MKIFASILLATVALTNADVSELVPNNFNQDPPLPLYPPIAPPPKTTPFKALQQSQHSQHQQQEPQPPPQPQPQPPPQPQPQYHRITQPSQHYFTTPRHTRPLPAVFPMPSGFSDGVLPLPIRKHATRHFRPRPKTPKKQIITKSFFIHSAPEDGEEEIDNELTQLAHQPRKHYNVLFVKAPTQTSKAAAVNFANAIKEEKTVVYVLSKKTTAADLQEAVAEEPQRINKPEVFFIKYNTDEEAAHAQRQIQSQYEHLGGSSTITDEGAVSVTSVVGSLDSPEEEEEASDVQQLPQEQPIVQPQEKEPENVNKQLVKSINSMSGEGKNEYLPPPQQ